MGVENKDYLKRTYDVNFECALKYCQHKNWAEARQSLKNAAQAIIKLVNITYGAEKEFYTAKAKSIAELLAKIPADNAQPAPIAGGGQSAQKPGEEKKDDQPKADVPKPTIEEALEELYALEGLKGVKDTVVSYIAMVKTRQEREANGLPVPPFSYHLVFTGNPGTGKTTVARIMSKIFCALNICEKPEVVEVVASNLIGEYVGHTANKTKKVIDSAKGGVLFLDEAYRLVDEGTKNFGVEAIGEILTEMENNRDKLIVIAAGYAEDMKRFLKANDGLPSRFKTTIDFADYNGEEMYRIFDKMCKKYKYSVTAEAQEILKNKFNYMYMNRGVGFANARDVRNMFEQVYASQSTRLANTPHTEAELSVIEAIDLKDI